MRGLPHVRHPQAAAVVGWLALAGCTDLLGLGVPEQAIPLGPLPAEYPSWWTVVETCSQLQADLQEVRWWLLPDASDPAQDDPPARYYQRGHEIVLPEGEERHGDLVRHDLANRHRPKGSARVAGLANSGDHSESQCAARTFPAINAVL